MSPDRQGQKNIYTTNILDISLANFVCLWFINRLFCGFPYFVLQPLDPLPLDLTKIKIKRSMFLYCRLRCLSSEKKFHCTTDNFFTFVISIRLDNSPMLPPKMKMKYLKYFYLFSYIFLFTK